MKVNWSERAENELSQNLAYLAKMWNAQVAGKFLTKLVSKINSIKSNPNQFPSYDSTRNIRKCLIRKQISVYYTFDESEIYILSVFNNKQTPEKLKF